MGNTKFGEKLQTLRKNMGYSQKEFAEYLEIPRSSMSAYENDHNSPTMEVLINVANKCNVSLDWLCGLSSSPKNISTLGDIADLLYKVLETNEIGLEIEVHDHLFNDLETENEKIYVKSTIFATDSRYKYNHEFCDLISHAKENYDDLKSYAITKEIYDIAKKDHIQRYNYYPLTQKQFPKLEEMELLKRRAEAIQKRMQELKDKQNKPIVVDMKTGKIKTDKDENPKT